ncbi:RNA polymerase sigma factor [Neobacillus dielmonensis]|uniref:RNA polymerase sigma factor n=1 Tax=Neobacillus dielmonensis TaxID=1347369 RepID=UPI0005A83C38|nr:sigma-70 family RNA polymerase sigma factor [Neobacillus dielmonensis]
MDWEQIWIDHWKEIYVYVFLRVRHQQEAEDITQETFIRAIRAEERYKEDVNVPALLKTIARNIIIDRWRKKQRTEDPLPLEPEQLLVDIGNDLGKVLEQKEQVAYALSLLNEEQRKIIVLRLLQDLTIKETAALLGRSESYVKVTQFRAIQKIKDLVKKKFLEEALR